MREAALWMTEEQLSREQWMEYYRRGPSLIVEPRQPEDRQAAETLQRLLNYQYNQELDRRRLELPPIYLALDSAPNDTTPAEDSPHPEEWRLDELLPQGRESDRRRFDGGGARTNVRLTEAEVEAELDWVLAEADPPAPQPVPIVPEDRPPTRTRRWAWRMAEVDEWAGVDPAFPVAAATAGVTPPAGGEPRPAIQDPWNPQGYGSPTARPITQLSLFPGWGAHAHGGQGCLVVHSKGWFELDPQPPTAGVPRVLGGGEVYPLQGDTTVQQDPGGRVHIGVDWVDEETNRFFERWRQTRQLREEPLTPPPPTPDTEGP